MQTNRGFYHNLIDLGAFSKNNSKIIIHNRSLKLLTFPWLFKRMKGDSFLQGKISKMCLKTIVQFLNNKLLLKQQIVPNCSVSSIKYLFLQ